MSTTVLRRSCGAWSAARVSTTPAAASIHAPPPLDGQLTLQLLGLDGHGRRPERHGQAEDRYRQAAAREASQQQQEAGTDLECAEEGGVVRVEHLDPRPEPRAIDAGADEGNRPHDR
jgi:hypothetical protein